MSNLHEISPALEERALDQDVIISLLETFNGTLDRSTLDPRFDTSGLTLEPDGTVCWKRKQGYFKPPTIEKIFDLMDDVIQATAKAQGVHSAHQRQADDKAEYRFTRLDSDRFSASPYMTFKVLRGWPGSFGRGPEGSPTAQQRKPALRHVFLDPRDIQSEIYILAHRLEYHLELSVYATTAHEADKLVDWVETTIANNLWYFKRSGVTQFLWTERMADSVKEYGENKMFVRSLKYHVALDRLSWYSETVLRELSLKLIIE